MERGVHDGSSAEAAIVACERKPCEIENNYYGRTLIMSAMLLLSQISGGGPLFFPFGGLPLAACQIKIQGSRVDPSRWRERAWCRFVWRLPKPRARVDMDNAVQDCMAWR